MALIGLRMASVSCCNDETADRMTRFEDLLTASRSGLSRTYYVGGSPARVNGVSARGAK